MKLGATRELFDYWNGIRGARMAPERSDIDPAAIRSVLADTFMLDVAEGFPVRLAGTRVGALFDTDGSGASFLDFWAQSERVSVADMLLAVADGAVPAVVGTIGAPAGRPLCSFEMLFLPLRHFGKTHSRILGIATAAAQPSWLGLAPAGPLRMASLRFIDAEEMRAARPRLRDSERPVPVRPGAIRGVDALNDGSDAPLGGFPVPALRGGVPAIGRRLLGRPALRLIEGGRPS